MMTQKKAVVSIILSTLSARGIEYKLGESAPVSTFLTDADKTTIRDFLFAGFRKGEIEMKADAKAKASDDAYLKSYVSGLLNNWVRKEKEFNQGNVYKAKNPGSRAGSGDEQIREMKKLLSQCTTAEDKAAVQSAIDARVAEIKPKTDVSIDASKLPEQLRHLAK